MSLKLKALTATLGVTALAVATAPSALASPTSPRTITDQVLAPFQIALNHGHVYAADGGTSMVSRVLSDGMLRTVASGPQPGEVAGVDLNRSGRSLAYTWTDHSNGSTGLTIKTRGKKAVTADLSGYEQSHNPDGKRTYGVPADTNTCAQDAIAKATGGPASYSGIIESHPYSVASWSHDRWIVADAAGNDLLSVNRWGKVSTLAVLPKQPMKITTSIATSLQLPECTVGVTYNFEPVPTDVEVDRHGMLWVSTLPGGPEDPSLGARGSVYKVNPWTGKATRMATGFLGATNLAVARNGAVYVTELFGGKVSVLNDGKVRTFAKVANPLSVEVTDGSVYVGTMAPFDATGTPTGNGSIVKIRR